MVKVYVMDRLDEIQSFDIAKNVVYVGRSHQHNDIRLKDPYVSNRHLKILKRGEKYFLKDLDSKNGTFVNGVIVSPEVEIEITEGVAVTLGMSVICLGKACLDKVMPFLDSILSSDDLDEIPSIQTMDRPLTFKRNMELISNVSDVLRKRLSMNESLETILSHILDLLRRIDRGAIILRDTRSGRITEVLSQHKDGSRGDSLSFSRTIVKRVLKEGKAFRVLDTFGVPSEELSKSIEMMRIKSALCVPMISRSQVRGAIYLDSIKEPNGFRKDDLILITTLGNSAAIAVENALLYEGKPGASLN